MFSGKIMQLKGGIMKSRWGLVVKNKLINHKALQKISNLRKQVSQVIDRCGAGDIISCLQYVVPLTFSVSIPNIPEDLKNLEKIKKFRGLGVPILTKIKQLGITITPEKYEIIEKIPLTNIELSRRSKNICRNRFETLGDLLKKSFRGLFSCSGAGPESVAELMRDLKQLTEKPIEELKKIKKMKSGPLGVPIPPEKYEIIKKISIDKIGLHVNLINACWAAGYKTLGNLLGVNPKKLLRRPMVGRQGVTELILSIKQLVEKPIEELKEINEEMEKQNKRFKEEHEIDPVLEEHIKGILTPREYVIVCMYYLDKPPKTLEEIGEKLSLSKERIRGIKQEALRRLKRAFQNDPPF